MAAQYDKNRICAECAFWFRSRPFEKEDWGDCRRYPPAVQPKIGELANLPVQRRTEWPATLSDQWCAEFRYERDAYNV